MISRFEIRIVNPKIVAVAYDHTRRRSFHFASELVWRFVPNLTRGDNRFVHETNRLFLAELCLHIRRGAATIANLRQQIFHLCGRKGLTWRACDQRKENERSEKELMHDFPI